MPKKIEGALESLRIEDNGTWPLIAHIHSETRKKRLHTIKVYRNGDCECSCENCQYRIHLQPLKDGSVCKHVTKWRDTLKREASALYRMTRKIA